MTQENNNEEYGDLNLWVKVYKTCFVVIVKQNINAYIMWHKKTVMKNVGIETCE